MLRQMGDINLPPDLGLTLGISKVDVPKTAGQNIYPGDPPSEGG